mgnify:CR=1 FL=1
MMIDRDFSSMAFIDRWTVVDGIYTLVARTRVFPSGTIDEADGDIPKFPIGAEGRIPPNKFVVRHYRIDVALGRK